MNISGAGMRLSVIIPTMGRPRDLNIALKSLLEQRAPILEVIIVDQSSDNGSERVCQSLADGFEKRRTALRYFHQTKPSITQARNRGIAESSGDILSFIDDDAELFADYYDEVMAAFSRNPDVGALSGNTLIKDQFGGWKGFLRKALMRFFLLNNFNGRMTRSGFGYSIFHRTIDRETAVEILPGCNMNFRRSFLDTEKFDEWFSGYGYREDTDLSYRVSRHARMLMIPGARLYHHCSPISRLSTLKKKNMQIRNYYYVFRKFRGTDAFSTLLFAYSVIGLLVIDFAELLTHMDGLRLRVFGVSLRAVSRLLFRLAFQKDEAQKGF